MNYDVSRARRLRWAAPLAAIIFSFGVHAYLGAAAPQQEQPATGRSAAPIDLTGDWVSIVTEDWRWRMVTPPKGDYASLPINAEGRRVADAWDPDEDIRAENQCRAYGVGNIMRMPGRVRIAWADDNTLRIDTDAGTQTRLLRFGESAPPGQPDWQGHSVASWEIAGGRGQIRGGSLKVVTTHVRPGYLRKNGVPYSDDAVITEYFDRHSAFDQEWFTVTTIVEDPKYLTQPFITSTDFRREPDSSKFNPTPCEVIPPDR